MPQGLTGWHLLVILAVILLLFGAAKLPALAKSMGQSARVFKGEMKAMKDENAAPETTTAPNGSTSASVQAPTDDVRTTDSGGSAESKP
ncbi:Sec-independent protein translocase subunit TatA [Microbacterium sp. BWT-B31]|uniref:Sec-independent protein translocase subunit TatA n=1 Tax=Microbacterium sp. BWT-B31 TaxID=3232072 RepID=UPI003528A1FB